MTSVTSALRSRTWPIFMTTALLLAPLGVGAQEVVASHTPTPTPVAELTATSTPEATAAPTVAPTVVPTSTPTVACEENEADDEQRDGATLEEQLQDAWTYSGAGNGPRNVVKLHNRRS